MKIIRQLLFFTMIFGAMPSAWSQTPPNLVNNPSFSVVNQKTGLPEKWSTLIRKGKNGTPECLFTITEDAQDDQKAIKISVPKQGNTQALAEFYQLVQVKPKTKYYFSVYIKNGSWPCSQCAVLEERSVTKEFLNFFKAKLSEQNSGPEQYCLHEISFETGANTRFVNISLRLQNLGFGEGQFDNVILFEIEGAK